MAHKISKGIIAASIFDDVVELLFSSFDIILEFDWFKLTIVVSFKMVTILFILDFF